MKRGDATYYRYGGKRQSPFSFECGELPASASGMREVQEIDHPAVGPAIAASRE